MISYSLNWRINIRKILIRLKCLHNGTWWDFWDYPGQNQELLDPCGSFPTQDILGFHMVDGMVGFRKVLTGNCVSFLIYNQDLRGFSSQKQTGESWCRIFPCGNCEKIQGIRGIFTLEKTLKIIKSNLINLVPGMGMFPDFSLPQN